MKLNVSEITEIIKKQISNFDITYKNYNKGIIISVSDGIVRIHGLSDVMQGEIILFPNNQHGMVLNLERDLVGVAVLGNYTNLSEGMEVISTGKVLEIPVGPKLLGRIVNTLGIPIDGKGSIENHEFSKIEMDAPSVIDRTSVNEPIQTGYKAIDTMIPIGRGQRELIIGDRQTGKTTIAIDTIINQKKTGIKCIYVSIGQKASSVAKIENILKQHDALKNTIIVVASASESASLQYLAPYCGCTMGEYFRDRGQDALIVYDDLSKQAIAYRQISLLLKRPPGREAFPGDIFYLHSRLLERSAKVSKEYVTHFTKGAVKKTGSLTALPIIETQSGDVSSFVPTNVISITDGQIFLETSLFNLNIRPAINPGISVSRIGGAAQSEIIKKLSKGIRTTLAQYRELASFSQFSSDLDKNTRKQLVKGQKVTEILKQKQNQPMSVSEQSIILFCIENNYLDKIELENINIFETKLLNFSKKNYFSLMKKIDKKNLLDKDTENELHNLLSEFISKSWNIEFS